MCNLFMSRDSDYYYWGHPIPKGRGFGAFQFSNIMCIYEGGCVCPSMDLGLSLPVLVHDVIATVSLCRIMNTVTLH